MAVDIYPVERMASWPLSHVGQKRLEGVAPTVANCDASACVIRPRWVATAGFHRDPRPVSRTAGKVMFSLEVARDGDFGLEAAAGEDLLASQMRTRDGCRAAAIAAAEPVGQHSVARWTAHFRESEHRETANFGASWDDFDLPVMCGFDHVGS